MKNYEKPMINVERFMANEYIAACGDTNHEYIFQCDAMGGITGAVFVDDGDGIFEPRATGILGGDPLLGVGYHACHEKHITEVGDEFITGWYVTGEDYMNGGDFVAPVIIWRGADGDNIHCTRNLNMNTWETAKS